MRGWRRMVSAREHHVLDTIKTGIQRRFDLIDVERLIDRNLTFRLGGWVRGRRRHQMPGLPITRSGRGRLVIRRMYRCGWCDHQYRGVCANSMQLIHLRASLRSVADHQHLASQVFMKDAGSIWGVQTHLATAYDEKTDAAQKEGHLDERLLRLVDGRPQGVVSSLTRCLNREAPIEVACFVSVYGENGQTPTATGVPRRRCRGNQFESDQT